MRKKRINHITPKIQKKFDLKKKPTSNVTRHGKSSDVDLFLVPETFFGMKATQKWVMDAVRSGFLKMSEQEENVGSDSLAHVLLGVLYDNCRHFSNPLSLGSARARYMDPEIFRFPGTILGHMAEKLVCKEPLMNVSVPRQWLGRGATAASGYQSVGPIHKYQGGWQTPAGYPPYVPKEQAGYSHHTFVIPKHLLHGRVGRLQPGAPVIGQHMDEREQK